MACTTTRSLSGDHSFSVWLATERCPPATRPTTAQASSTTARNSSRPSPKPTAPERTSSPPTANVESPRCASTPGDCDAQPRVRCIVAQNTHDKFEESHYFDDVED